MKILKKLLFLVSMLPTSCAFAMEETALSKKDQEKIHTWLLLSRKINFDDQIVKVEYSLLSDLLPKKVLAIFSNNEKEKYHYDTINCLNQLSVYTVSVASESNPERRSCCVIDIMPLENILQKQDPIYLKTINKE